MIRSPIWVSSETYSEVAKKVEFIQWLMAQSDLSMQNKDLLTWFNRYDTFQDGSVHARAALGPPPNPPLAQKCTLCKDFTHAGSTMNRRDCGHVEQKPREVTYTQSVDVQARGRGSQGQFEVYFPNFLQAVWYIHR